ncbi:MAG: hypothetical protein ACJ8FO_02740 [Sphingomicrobium sp.]
MKRIIIAAVLSGIMPPADAQTIVAAPPHTANFDGFIVTEGDISDRPYTELGPVTAKAGKFSWVSRNPDRSDIDTKLRLKALQMGADAVVRVHYTPTGASMMSWGGIKGDGVAIKYQAIGGH